MRSFVQFVKFGFVGVINTMVDLGVLNVLIFIFGLSSGLAYVFFKILSFFAAVINSYFMNKYFVFNRSKNNFSKKREFFSFFSVSLIGILVNTSSAFVAYSILLNYTPFISEHVSANFGAVFGSVIVLFWNFLGYKFFVFKTSYEK